ncbi:MAG: DNA repair protein RecN [Clostridia bacterium]|nr:DNA repair protein RecN [Clostridia bacterium]
MLSSLYIENIAVISKLSVDFSAGFSVLTGETGAGKSIIVDSINMLLGNRVSRELVRKGCDKATVVGVFEGLDEPTVRAISTLGFAIEDDSLMIQCTLTKEGRSSVKLNGQPITKAIQREIAHCLVNIHGQNDNQRLLQKSYHLSLLDAFAELSDLLAEYRIQYSELVKARKELNELTLGEAERLRRIEMLRYQIADISGAGLKPDTEDKLEKEKKRLLSLERVNKQTKFAYKILYGSDRGASAYYIFDRAIASLQSISDAIPDLGGLIERLTDMKYEVMDIAETVSAYTDDDCEDATERINKIESVLDAVSKLKRKYGSSIPQILEYKEMAEAELSKLENSAARTDELDKYIALIESKALALAEKLSEKRKEAAAILEARIIDTLRYLDMSGVRFKVGINQLDRLSPDGLDDVELLIATNKGDDPMPLIKIASGGELSRIMLALKSVLSDKDNVGTVIYDEVDTGISGKTSHKVGIKLKQTAKNVQVICVTHSAQIASLADAHYLISKSDTETDTRTSVAVLDYNDRVEEIARILGGINVTDAQRTAAAEMINEGNNY